MSRPIRRSVVLSPNARVSSLERRRGESEPSDYIYYAGLAFAELGDSHFSKKSFNQLVSFGERYIFDQVGYDYFSVSLPEIEVYQDELSGRNRRYCKYLSALGYAGLRDRNKALGLCEERLREQPDDQGASLLYTKEI